MSGLQVTIPLQLMCRLMVATQVGRNVTLPVVLEHASAGPTSSPQLPSGYVAFPEFGVAYKLFETQLDQDAARESCLEDNAQLAVIDSREKIEKVLNHFTRCNWFWVGFSKNHDTEKWITIDGKSTNNLPWGSSEPSEDGKCVLLSRLQNGLWAYSCTDPNAYLCEIPWPRN